MEKNKNLPTIVLGQDTVKMMLEGGECTNSLPWNPGNTDTSISSMSSWIPSYPPLKANPAPDTSLEEDQMVILPMNCGYMVIKGDRREKTGHAYYCFSSYEEVIEWLKDNPILNKDESTVAENI